MVLYKHSLLTTIFSITIAIIIIVILNRYITYGNTNHESFSNLNILNYHIVENWNTYENYIADELIETNIVNIINRAVSKEGIVFALNLIKENVDDNIETLLHPGDTKKQIVIKKRLYTDLLNKFKKSDLSDKKKRHLYRDILLNCINTTIINEYSKVNIITMPLILSDENVISLEYNGNIIIFLGLYKLKNGKPVRSFNTYPKWNYNVYKSTKEEEDEYNMIKKLEILEQKCEETNMTYKEEQAFLASLNKPLGNPNKNDLLIDVLLKHINNALEPNNNDDIFIIEEMPRYKGFDNLCDNFNSYTNKEDCLFLKDKDKSLYNEIIESKKDFNDMISKDNISETNNNCIINNDQLNVYDIDNEYSFI